ncbi:hypothetical protein Clacol_001077 [Clathrus columnatus]|uniref:Uncharacterized protein n=1 Tax=Clathrus columnatus TaxID=1419009 RepID=A0AAV5A1J3_9AGAM|nr:hypothetical protein Clacol_001077 [Clathrus columnatus]
MACAGYQLSDSKFAEIQNWRADRGRKRVRDFYAGRWKDVPEDQRWWEEAFRRLEPERVRRLAAVKNYSGLPQTDPLS